MRAASLATLLCLAACAEEHQTGAPPPRIVTGAPHLRVAPDPGPVPREAPPRLTLWRQTAAGWRAEARVVSVAPGGRAYVDADGALWLDDRRIDDHVLPGVSVAADGTVAYTRCPRPPKTDVWRARPGRAPERVTSDGASDRPVLLPDGRLLYISSASSGWAGWVLDGRRLGGRLPIPAYPDRTHLEAGRVVFHDGEGWWTLDPRTGRAEKRP